MNPGSTQHVSVLADEVLALLSPSAGQTLVDGTLGGGGHARRLAQAVAPTGRVIALDRDPAAVDAATAALRGLPIVVCHANYSDLPEVLAELGFAAVDGILLDLGISSDQLADADRGFSFHSAGPLDLRFDPTRGEPAWKLVERLSAEHLADLIYRYGEERYSRQIARRIIDHRRKQPIRTAAELSELIRRSVPRSRHERIDPATRTFQALRIAVNDELKWLEVALRRLPECLRIGGRLAVISFHSLEDRLVKEAFRDDPRWELVTRRPVRPSEQELAENPRSRSAKLRVAARKLWPAALTRITTEHTVEFTGKGFTGIRTAFQPGVGTCRVGKDPKILRLLSSPCSLCLRGEKSRERADQTSPPRYYRSTVPGCGCRC